jgi:Flp pilus assembly protein CpaB
MATGGRRNGRILVFIALLLIVILAVALFLMRDQLFPAAPASAPITSGTPSVPAAVELIDIVVLAQPVALGGEITAEMVEMKPFPKDKFVDSLYFTDLKDVVGKRARYPLVPPIVLSAGLLSNTAVGGFASSQIPAGSVAISIPIESAINSVSNALQPGDHVSVLVSLLIVDLDQNFQTKLPNNTADLQVPGTSEPGSVWIPKGIKITSGGATGILGRTELDPVLGQPVYVQPGETNQRPRMVSQLLISDAIVLGIGDFSEAAKEALKTNATPTPAPAAGAAQPTPGPTPVPNPIKDATNLITLIVSPQDAVTINYVILTKGAKLNLVLRSASENKQFKTEAVTLQFLMDQYNIPLPSKLQYGLEPSVGTLDYKNSPTVPSTK